MDNFDRKSRRGYTLNIVLSVITLFGMLLFTAFVICPGVIEWAAHASIDEEDPPPVPVPVPEPPPPPKPTPPPDDLGKEWCENVKELNAELEMLNSKADEYWKDSADAGLSIIAEAANIVKYEGMLLGCKATIKHLQLAEATKEIILHNAEAEWAASVVHLRELYIMHADALKKRTELQKEIKLLEDDLKVAEEQGKEKEVEKLKAQITEKEKDYNDMNIELEVLQNRISTGIDGVNMSKIVVDKVKLALQATRDGITEEQKDQQTLPVEFLKQGFGNKRQIPIMKLLKLN